MRIVFTDELKFEINRFDSKILFVKSVSNTILPNVNGVFIDSGFHKDNTPTPINQKVSYNKVTYRIVTNIIIFTMSFSISKLDISPIPATTKDPLSELMGSPFFTSFLLVENERFRENKVLTQLALLTRIHICMKELNRLIINVSV